MIVYLHIPKTAGNTVKSVFKSRFSEENTLFLNGSDPKSDFSLMIKEASHAGKHLVFGHIDFGISEYLNSDAKFLTILRHPLDRIVSHYYYVLRRKEKHYLYEQVTKPGLSLSQFVNGGFTNELDNGQVRMLIGAGGFHKNEYLKYDIPFGKCEPWMLEEAKRNLTEKFAFAGVQEKLVDSLILMKQSLHWNDVLHYKSANITKNRPAIDSLTTEERDSILECNQLDVELYDFVLDRLNIEIARNKNTLFYEKLRIRFNQSFNRIRNL